MTAGGIFGVQDVIGRAAHGEVTLLTLDTAAACAFGPEVRAAMLQALQATPLPRAMVIAIHAPAMRTPIGSDAPEPAPKPGKVAEALADAPFPVVFAVAGTARGAMAELALGGDVILAAGTARFAIPDISLGVIPGGGATQLLPRRIGAKAALDMLLSGRLVTAAEALQLGMVDRVVSGDLVAAALARATEMAAHPRPVRAAPGLDAKVYAAEVAAARGALLIDALPAEDCVIDAVEAALVLPLAQGLTLETTLREDLLASDEAQALRAAEAAGRIARRVPKVLAGLPVAPVGHLYVEGMTSDTAMLAFAALSAGMRVTLAEADRGVLSGVLKSIAERQDRAAAAGRLDVQARDADWARLATLAPGPLLPEGVDALLFGPGLVARVTETGAQVPPTVPRLLLGAAPGVLGLALAPSGRIASLSGLAATPAAATAWAFLARIGLPAIAVGSEGPEPGAAVAEAGRTALARLLARGVRDDAILDAMRSVQAARPDLPADALDPRANYGQPLAMPRAEIIARWWSAMAAAGLDCLAAGTAACPADIDHLMVAGHGFPRRLGGPMHQADRRGLLLLRQDLRLWSRDDRIWAPPPMLDRLLGEGRTVASLNPRLAPISPV